MLGREANEGPVARPDTLRRQRPSHGPPSPGHAGTDRTNGRASIDRHDPGMDARLAAGPQRRRGPSSRIESNRVESKTSRNETKGRLGRRRTPRERSNSADPVQWIRFREFRAFTGRGRSDESTGAQAGPATSPALVPQSGGSLRVHASDDLQHAVRAKYCPPSLSCMSMRSMTTRTSFEAYSVGLDGKWHHVKQRVPTFFLCDISGPSEDAPKAAWAASPRNEKHWALTHPSA